jgi:hypothetical protein
MKKLSDEVTPDNPIYPRRNASFRFPARYSFTMFYSVSALVAFLAALLVNLLTTPNILWSLIAGAGLVYLYVLIRHTIMTSYGSAAKIFLQGFLIAVLVWIVQGVTHSGNWAYEYVIPMILLANTVVLWALAIVRRVRRGNYSLNLLIISVLDFVPVIWYLTGHSVVLWTMIVSASISLATMVPVLTVFGKFLLTELKRLFHM